MRERRWTSTVSRRVYGVTVTTDFPFRTPLPPGRSKPDLEFTRVRTRPVVSRWEDGEPVFESVYLTDDGESQVRLYRPAGFAVFRQVGVADWYVWPDRIVCQQHDVDATEVVELYFLSLLLGFWLESRSTLVLHASAVRVKDRGVVFLATNTGGKTSLAGTIMQAGYPLLTDDFLAVSWPDGRALGQPGFPQMRMWPDLADHFLGRHADLPRVLPDTDKRRVPAEAVGRGGFCSDATRLSRLYLPVREKAGEAVRIEPVAPAEALIELVRESFLGTVLEKTGLHRSRFSRLASLADRVPMRRVRYPSGFERLPEVRDAILADLQVDR